MIRFSLSLICVLQLTGCARVSIEPDPARSWVLGTRPAGVVSIGSAEIVAYDRTADSLLVTGEAGVWRVNLPLQGTHPSLIKLDLADDESVTSVAADPLGRGFAVAAVANEASPPRAGRAIFFEADSGDELFSVTTGHHPDCVIITPDGRYAITADEGEPKNEYDPQGGVTLIRLQGQPTRPDQAAATTLTLENASAEPEYLAFADDGVWVSVQESSRLRRVDLRGDSPAWGLDVSLGPRRVIIDANDDDRLKQEHEVFALPQPDSIVRVQVGAGSVIVAANEGDPREGENARAWKLDPDSLTPRLQIGADPSSPSHRFAFGTRDLSIHDASTGELLATTGAQIESIRESLALGRGGPDAINRLDARSDNRGPEPEGLASSDHLSGMVFVGLERIDAVLGFDVSDPQAPRHVHTIDLTLADVPGSGPEGMALFQREGTLFLAVACEGSGTLHVFEIIRGERGG